MSFSNLAVIPAKAGIQGSSVTAPALDPRFRGGDSKPLRLLTAFSDRHLVF